VILRWRRASASHDILRVVEIDTGVAVFPGDVVTEEVMGLAVLNYKERPPIKLFDGLHEIYRDIIEQDSASVVYGHDRNDPSARTLYRTDFGHDVLDFSRANPRNVLFNHQSGFLVKFIPTDANEWKRILASSLTLRTDHPKERPETAEA